MAKILISLYILATSSALILLKLGTKTGGILSNVEGRTHLNINAFILGGIALYGFSFLLYTYLISKYELGYIIPLTTACVYVIIFLGSYFIFHEVFTVFKIMGICLILAGVILLNLKG